MLYVLLMQLIFRLLCLTDQLQPALAEHIDIAQSPVGFIVYSGVRLVPW